MAVGRMAYAEDCKSFYVGSIPAPASKKVANLKKVLAIRLNFVYKALIADLA